MHPSQHRQRRIARGRVESVSRRSGPRERTPGFSRCAGFTLVEMLVAVAVVMLMMSMFAVVFDLAAGSIHTQRGISENNQRARTIVTVIANDIKHRTFRVVVPFGKNELPPDPGDADFSIRNFEQRKGFLYISENNVNDDTDDVLHLTLKLSNTTGDVYVGKATQLFTTGLFADSNEPDRDNGNPVVDSTAESIAAEVVIFMRSGRLYRRILLLRDPLERTDDDQPTDNTDEEEEYFLPDNDLYAENRNFWNEFDFSAHFGVNEDGDSVGAVFHGIDYLENEKDGEIQVGSGSLVIAALSDPRFRFGHNQVSGLPREFIGTAGGATNNRFIGRFTHEETSFQFFQFPHRFSQDLSGDLINDGNPMEQNPSSRQLNLVNGVVTDATGVKFLGPRRAEDLLLANVHAFDIKVWDEALQQFVDVGHDRRNEDGDPIGDFNRDKRINSDYGPNGPSGNNVFDTWRPDLDIDDNGAGDGTIDRPPYRPFDAMNNVPRPLKAIQITIRYYDVSSEQLRQVTQQISLTK